LHRGYDTWLQLDYEKQNALHRTSGNSSDDVAGIGPGSHADGILFPYTPVHIEDGGHVGYPRCSVDEVRPRPLGHSAVRKCVQAPCLVGGNPMGKHLNGILGLLYCTGEQTTM
jgi:hypothetical protein